MTQHSLLSPSASDRWLHCAGSVAANATATRGPASVYATEGTAAHSLLEQCLRLNADPSTFLEQAVHEDHTVSENMAEAVAVAVDWIRSYMTRSGLPPSALSIERWVEWGRMIGRPDGGTADVVIEVDGGEAVILDYKHGAGVPVEARNNTQLALYAAGVAYERSVRGLVSATRYRLVVVQPRARHKDGPVREWTLSAERLAAFMRRVARQADIIEAQGADAPRKAGDWCRWCAVAGRCRAAAETALRVAAIEFGQTDAVAVPPTDLDTDDLAWVLRQLPFLEQWSKAVMAEAVRFLEEGGELDGFKLVQGRTQRAWESDTVARAWLAKLGFKPDEYAPRAVVGVADAERLIKKLPAPARKRADARLPKLLKHKIPALHVAPADDPRPAYSKGSEFNSASQ